MLSGEIALWNSHHNYYYYILATKLTRVRNHDYLGVTMSSDLNWLRHVKNSNMASRTICLL